MHKNISFKKKILIYSMLLMLILVMMSSILNYVMARRVIKEESESGIQNAVSQFVNSNDIMVDDLKKSVSTIIDDRQIEMFSSQFAYLGYKEKSLVYNKLSEILNINAHFTSCYVYYPRSGRVIDVNTYSPQFISVAQCDNQELIAKGYEQFSINQDSSESNIFPVNTKGGVEWIIILPINPYQPDIGVLMVTISPGYFYNNLNTLHYNEHLSIYIVDANHQTLDCELPPSIMKTDFYKEMYSNSVGKDTVKMDSGKYLVGYITSNYTKWKYIYNIKLDVIYEKIYFLTYATLLSVAFCLIVGVGLCISLAGITYKPIKNIANLFNADDKNSDGLSTIKNGIEQLLDDNKTLNQQIFENRSILRHSFMISLLDGDFEEYGDAEENFCTYDISFKNDNYYFVFILSIEASEDSNVSYSPQQLLMFELLFEDTLHKNFADFKGLHLERIKTSKETQTFILGFDSKPQNQNLIAELIEDTCNQSKKIAKLSLSIGCSELERGSQKISLLYKQAENALKYRYIIGYGKVIQFNDLPQNMLSQYDYPYSIEKKILSLIRRGEFSQVHQSLHDFHDYITKNVVELSQCRFFFMHLFSSMLKDINELNCTYLENTNQDSLFEKILSSKTTMEIIHIIDDYVQLISNIVNQQQMTKSNEIAETVKLFISENYYKPELCLDMISEELKYSTSYISKVFKLSEDISIKDYITEKRLDKACELLKNTDNKLKDVAISVGYTQQRSFIEIFKKYKNVTPSEYKNLRVSNSKSHKEE